MIKSLLGSASRRLGTMVGGVLLGAGASQETTTLVVNGVIAGALFLADLGLSYAWSKK